jgi:hypothetical protein
MSVKLESAIQNGSPGGTDTESQLGRAPVVEPPEQHGADGRGNGHLTRSENHCEEDGDEDGNEDGEEDGDEEEEGEEGEEVVGDGDEAEEDEDDDDDDDEPTLKYQKIMGSLPNLLKKDFASALTISAKRMVLCVAFVFPA